MEAYWRRRGHHEHSNGLTRHPTIPESTFGDDRQTPADDEDIQRTFEPFCPSNMVRLQAIGEVQKEGIDTCITMTPLLMVTSPYAFADALIESGVRKFIAQPFHFQRGKFLAGTRDKAFDLMAEKLGCDHESFREEYLEHYRMVFGVLQDMLPELGEGKDGFAPPF